MSLDIINKSNKTIKKPVKLLTIIILIVIIIGTIFIAYNKNLLNFSSNNKEYEKPRIVTAKTIDNNTYNNIDSILLAGEDPSQTIEFERGDTVCIYYIFTNIIHDKCYDIIEMISIYYNDSLIDEYYNKFSSSSSEETLYDTYNFKTNKSMSLGVYIIDINLYDNITGNSASKSIGFVLKERSPDILILTTASEVNGYQNYTQKTNFTQDENIYLYTEYTDIQTTNQNTQCNLYIKINITTNQTEIYNINLNKTTVQNNAHYWEIIPNDDWANDSIYIVTIYLLDRYLFKNATSQTFFRLV